MNKKRPRSLLALAIVSIILLSPTMSPNAFSQSNVQQSEYFTMSVSQNSDTFPYGPTLDDAIKLGITPHNGFSGKIELSAKYTGNGISVHFSNQSLETLYSVSPLNPYSQVPIYPQVRVIIQTDSYQWRCNGFDCMPGPSTDPGNYTIYIYGNSTNYDGIVTTEVVPINLIVSKPVPFHPSNPSCIHGMMWDQEDGICITIPTAHLSPSTYSIPSWVKNNAKWWSQGTMGDSDFVNGMQYLINKGIVVVPRPSYIGGSGHIPYWIKIYMNLWESGKGSDDSFVQAIQFLISQEVLTL